MRAISARSCANMSAVELMHRWTRLEGFCITDFEVGLHSRGAAVFIGKGRIYDYFVFAGEKGIDKVAVLFSDKLPPDFSGSGDLPIIGIEFFVQ